METPVVVSSPGTCAECSIRVWLAPASVRLIKIKDFAEIKTLCEECWLDSLEQNAGTEHIANELTPGGLQDAMAQIRKVHDRWR